MATKDEVARHLAHLHYDVEAGMTKIFRVMASPDRESRAEEPIKLLEVNEYTSPSGVMPLGFGPSPGSGVPFPSIILEVTPEEYERIESRELALPPGWTEHVLIPRP